jgi:hypothetical protein
MEGKMNNKYKPECENCGEKLHQYIEKDKVNYNKPIIDPLSGEKIDGLTMNFPIEKVKEFNNNLKELGEFCAWVCLSLIHI